MANRAGEVGKKKVEKPAAVYRALSKLWLCRPMTSETVTLSLPPDLARTLHTLAQERGESVDDLARGMLGREETRLRSARATVDAREHRVARLRQLLTPDMQRARSWADLRSWLALYGVALRGAGGGLMLHDLITGELLCPSAALGFGYRDLMRRLGESPPDEISALPAA